MDRCSRSAHTRIMSTRLDCALTQLEVYQTTAKRPSDLYSKAPIIGNRDLSVHVLDWSAREMTAGRHVETAADSSGMADSYRTLIYPGHGPARINVRVIHYSSGHILSLCVACRLSLISNCILFAFVVSHHRHHQDGRRIGSSPVSANGSLTSLFSRHQSS